MAAIVYATFDDLTAWLDVAPPANALSLLRTASFVVAEACMRDPYNDAPTGTAVDALRDATCAQVASWVALGLDPDSLGLDVAPVKKSSILSADVERDTSGQATARASAARDLAPQACAILTAAGLIYLPVPAGAPATDPLPQWGQGRRWWPLPETMSGEVECLNPWPFQ